MRFTIHSEYKRRWADALNLEALVEPLSDLLMGGGFAGGMVRELRGEKEATQQVQRGLTRRGGDFLDHRALKGLFDALGKADFGSHDTPHLATGIEADAASKYYESGDTVNLDIPNGWRWRFRTWSARSSPVIPCAS